MKATRQRMLEILEHRPGITAAELSRALQITQADIRHHLSNMIEEGLVIPAGMHKTGRRGRPARRFRLATSVHKDNFDLLSSALLTTALGAQATEQRSAVLENVAAQFAAGTSTKGPLSQRLVQVVTHLNRLGYKSRWEAHAEAPRLIFERCPFAALRPQHPELCQIDRKQLEILANERVELVDAGAHLENGFCLFLIG